MRPDELRFRVPLTARQMESCAQVVLDARPLAGSSERLVDIGCGKGEALAVLRAGARGRGQPDWEVHGIDPDPQALAAARERHAVGDGAGSAAAHWQAARWEDATPIARPWAGALCLGSRHAFGPDGAAALRMLDELRAALIPGGLLWIADGIWRQPPAPAYLEATGLQARELLPLADWHAAFAARGLRLLHEEATSPEDFEAYERVFWAQGGEHWEAWSQAFLRWGRETMGFVGWVLQQPD